MDFYINNTLYNKNSIFSIILYKYIQYCTMLHFSCYRNCNYFKLLSRRSRSRDRRSRSTERLRRRSSRSPMSRRYSPRHRSRTRSRSLEKRPRKRSPFINELARQLRDGAMPTGVNTGGYVPPATIEEIAPLLNVSGFKQEAESRPPLPSYVHQPAPLPPPPPAVLAGGPSFMNFDPMNFEPVPPPHTLTPVEYSSGPVMYNQPNSAPVQAPPPPPTIRPQTLLSTPVPPPPQPVPAPIMDHTQIPYNSSRGMPSVQQSPIRQFESLSKSSNHSAAPSTSSQSYIERGSSTSYNEFRAPREERMKTPEPPVISKPKVIAMYNEYLCFVFISRRSVDHFARINEYLFQSAIFIFIYELYVDKKLIFTFCKL